MRARTKTKILLTSFQTWLPHQRVNSSDELLARIQKLDYSSTNVSLFFIRKLPVNIELASKQVISTLESINPDVVICCGMAEKRAKLAVESRAYCQQECLYTCVDLTEFTNNLMLTEISHDAGKFVCEGLYYQVLKHIKLKDKQTVCIFVHVPLLNNLPGDLITQDFQAMFLWFSRFCKQRNC